MSGRRAQGALPGAGAAPWAVVPCKDLDAAKRRLGAVLAPGERRAFARAMLEDVLCALAAAPALAGLAVVTRDGEAAALAGRYGARVIEDRLHAGPNAAAALAVEALAGAESLLVVPADVPLVTPAEIARLCDGHGPAPSVTLAPALADMGSNGVLCSPPGLLPFRYGPNSLARHREAARGRGVTARLVRLAGLGLDIDRPEDLARFLAHPSATRSRAVLEECGVAARLRDERGARPAARAAGATA